MSSALFELHLKDVFKLSKTLVIKSEASALVLNQRILMINYPVDEARPHTWKYYRNLAGEYHDLDEPMTVKSLDTLMEIAFTKENLMVHRATAKAYAYGTPYYHGLVARFPKQEQLILGILNPVDLNTAVTAPNHQILWYDKTLVEAQESNVIGELQLFIDAWWRKNDSPAYGLYHDLYIGGLYSAFFTALPGAILGIRLKNCHTQYAHSFHIWSYLAGKGGLDEFQDYLTTKQMLWLYRNIDYLTAHVGKESTHKELIQHLLTERGYPLAGFDLQQNVSLMPDELTPEVEAVLVPQNYLDQQPKARQTYSIVDLVHKELPLARENQQYQNQEIVSTIDEVKHNRVTKIGTRVFESKVTDRSESNHVRVTDVLLNHWLYLSHTRRYNVTLSVVNPQTGEAFNITTKDAFPLWLWLMNHSLAQPMTYVPTVKAKRIRRPQLPTMAELKALVHPEYVTDELIKDFYKGQPAFGLTVSTEAFNALGYELYQADLHQYDLYTKQQHLWSRVEAELVGLAFWMDIECPLAPDGTTYSQWFNERSLLVEELSKFEAAEMAAEIFSKATGTDLSNKFSLKAVHGAMIALFQRLNAYSVQVIQSISETPLMPVGFPPIRVGDDWSKERTAEHLRVHEASVLADHSKDCDYLPAQAIGAFNPMHISAKERGLLKLKPYIDVATKGPGVDRIRVRLPNLRWSVISDS